MVLNCQSLAPKIDTVMDITKCKDVHVCFLNETWFKKAKNKTTQKIEDYGYKSFHSNVFGRGKGTAILLKCNVNYKKVELNLNFTSFDAVVLHVTNATYLVSLYRYYRWGSAFDTFLCEFASFLSDLTMSCDSFIICGDLNVHYNDPLESYTSKFLDALQEFDLQCLTPIVPTQARGNTLDLVISSALITPDIKGLDVETHYPLGDHHPTFFSIHNFGHVSNVYCQSKKLVRRVKNIEMDLFRSDLLDIATDRLSALPDTFKTAV